MINITPLYSLSGHNFKIFALGIFYLHSIKTSLLISRTFRKGFSLHLQYLDPSSRVWLWLWVRCYVCPLLVRLPVCPLPLSPSPLSICVLCAANVVENGVVFPPVSCCQPVFMSDCVVLDFVSLCPTTSVTGPTARGAQKVYKGWAGRSSGGVGGIHHQPLALGLRTRGYQ